MQPDIHATSSGPQRLLFVVSLYSASNTNNAGHCYSIRELSTRFAKAWPDCQMHILVLGNLAPGPLRDAVVPVTRIDFTDIDALTFVKRILKFGDDFAPTHVHSFDNKSHFFGRWIARRTGAKTYLTKPGGPNPGRFFPSAPDIICFSQENLEALRHRRSLAHVRFHYLPQRVATPEPDFDRIARLRDHVGPGDVVLRICRIGPYYERSIRQTFALARAMRDQGLSIRALIVGTMQSQDTLDQLAHLSGEGDMIVSDPLFTHNAAALIPIASGVVGAGRSLIEAALMGKPVFCPAAEGDLPILVTRENWQYLSATNFSERTMRPGTEPPLPTVAEVVSNGVQLANADIRDAMSLDAAIPAYADMYAAPQRQTTLPLDFLINSGSVWSKYFASKAKSRTGR